MGGIGGQWFLGEDGGNWGKPFSFLFLRIRVKTSLSSVNESCGWTICSYVTLVSIRSSHWCLSKWKLFFFFFKFFLFSSWINHQFGGIQFSSAQSGNLVWKSQSGPCNCFKEKKNVLKLILRIWKSKCVWYLRYVFKRTWFFRL